MKRLIPILIAITIIAAIIYFVFYPEYQERYAYSDERADLMAFFGVADETEVAIILQDTKINEKARYWDDTYYFDLDTVYKYFNSRFYVDEGENLLLYSFPDDTVRVSIGERTVSGKSGQATRSYIIARHEASALTEGDTLYIAADFLKDFCNFSYEAYKDPGRMQVYTEWGSVQTARINRDTAVRYRGGVKSEILTEVENGERVTVLEQMETWAKVKTDDAFIGYVENRRLSSIYSEGQVPVTSFAEPEYASQVREHKISMGWHYIGGPSGNDSLIEVTQNTKGLNVISPTWFFLSDAEGNFSSFASASYVRQARELGLEVWALVENMTHSVDMFALLSSTTKRARLIENLIAAALEYELDGINIDFEDLRAPTGPHFVQFIRELSIPCRELGLVLSVDNYVPYGFNEFYGRTEQGIFADYVVIMGYDEHFAGSDKAGSVASINFVEHGIIATAQQVPLEKVINGVPFYTRIWETKGANVSSQAVGMETARQWVDNRGLTPQWDEETCQYYAEHKDADGVFHQVWLEDARSLSVKFNVMAANDIGGVAFWRLGMETPDVWDEVLLYLE